LRLAMVTLAIKDVAGTPALGTLFLRTPPRLPCISVFATALYD
jgi:hypothetical protein